MFSSSKNLLKKIKCLDHVVGVLRFVACKGNQRVNRRDGDGLVTHLHVHSAQQPIDENLRHEGSHKCPKIREEISEKVPAFLDLSCKTNWTVHELHNSEACLCCYGKMGEEERAAVNEKRAAYNKTGAGLEMKKAYREKANVRRQIFLQLTMLDMPKKAHLCHEQLKNWSRCCRYVKYTLN